MKVCVSTVTHQLGENTSELMTSPECTQVWPHFGPRFKIPARVLGFGAGAERGRMLCLLIHAWN